MDEFTLTIRLALPDVGHTEVDDPICLHAPTERASAISGACNFNDGMLVMSRPNGMFDAQTCWDFYRKLRRHRRGGRKMVIIIDNARYHHACLHEAWRDEVAGHFCLHFLPPYSPELNPIERVWKLIRRRCLHNRYFAALDEVIAAVEPTFRLWSRPNATLRRLCGI
ncbi:MAG: transposase [Verrucomicrobiae bacterium]|nr:transposase [Verrucomicrobiae bacterium]